jgi:hypothetical protein
MIKSLALYNNGIMFNDVYYFLNDGLLTQQQQQQQRVNTAFSGVSLW